MTSSREHHTPINEIELKSASEKTGNENISTKNTIDHQSVKS